MPSGRTPDETPEHPAAAAGDPLVPALRYWLEYAGHAFELREGPLVLGRSADCNLVLEDALVSRRHAQLRVEQGRVVVEDLNSANGVLVNGERITSTRVLVPGDRIEVGKQQMQIRARTMAGPGGRGRHVGAQTLLTSEGSEKSEQFNTITEVDTFERAREGLELIGGVVEKILALGRPDEAERMLTPRLAGLLDVVQSGFDNDGALRQAARYAVKLASATGKGAWIDYIFRLYGCVKRPLPGEVVDELYQVLRRVQAVNVDVLREYVSTLRANQSLFGPAERFLVQRIEGLERLATLR